MNIFELYNECTILLLSYLLIPLSDHTTGVEAREIIGWAMTAITLVCVCSNYVNLLCALSYIIFTLIRGVVIKMLAKCKKASL